MKSTFRAASKTHPGIYWKTFAGNTKEKQLWVCFEAGKEWKDGKPKRRQKWERIPGTKPSIKQAKQLRAQRMKEAQDGHHGEKADALFCDLEGAYREAVVATRANARTREAYEFQLERLLKRFGPTRVTQIGAGDLEGFLAELVEQYSPAQVQKVWGRLRDVFKWAVARDYVPRNPFDKVLAKPPKIGRSEKNPMTPEEVEVFFAYLREHEPFLYPMYRFWIETGMRQGELLGCKWENLIGDRYQVQEQLLRDGTFGSPKDESYGEVALSLETVEALEAFRQGEVERRGLRKKPEKGLMFCKPDGRHLNYRSEAKEVRKLLKAASLKTRTPHEMRHTCASLLIADGASIVQVAGQLRHSDPSITLRVYAHLFPRDLRPVFQPKVITAARLAG